MDTIGSQDPLDCYDPRREQVLFDASLRECKDAQGDLYYIGSLLQRAYRLFPNDIALIEDNKKITYQEFYFRALLFSKKLIAVGVCPGDRVFLFYENSLEFTIAYFGILQAGAVAVPLNIFLHARELAHIINDAQPTVCIVSDTLMDRYEEAFKTYDIRLKPIVVTRHDFDWDTSYNQSQVDSFEPLNQDNDSLAVLLYTSGTTGSPKGVMLSSRNAVINTLQCRARFKYAGLDDQERFFCVLPLFHVFAQNSCLWLPVLTGSTIILVKKIDRKLIKDGLRHKPTLFFGFPALYGLLCLMKNASLDSVKMFVSGADMLPDKIRGIFSMIYRRKICTGYGLTEAAPVVAVHFGEADAPAQVVGHAVVGVTLRIVNDRGEPCLVNEIGELWVKGDNIMLGYYNSPEQTAQVLVDGWLNTGDRASLDYAGNVAIRGRSKDLIIHKGFNIYPAEVENILLKHPDVVKAAVVGEYDENVGQIPVAYVAAKADHEEIRKRLHTLCSQSLAAYKVPRKIVCLDDLPMTPTGKIDKKQLNS
jgi:long-chain acyl-CoA synthetase